MHGDVVCNASPLIFLAKINKLNLLDMYSLHVPLQVETEILKGLKRKREDANLIIAYLSQRKIKPFRTTFLKDLPNFLGSGEKAVISLAVKEKIERVLIDEAKARTVARFKGLKPKGTLGILWDAYKSGRINKEHLEELTLELIEKGYRIKEELFIEFLKKIKTLD
jgi:predicted nucleic acid-binding protein